MLIHPNIDPVALNLGVVKIHWYGLMHLIAFASAWWLGSLRACMAYVGVGLNLIRAKMAKTPEASAHTSIKKRIQKAQTAYLPNHPQQVTSFLPFAGNPRDSMPKGLLFKLTDYIELIDIGDNLGNKPNASCVDELSPTAYSSQAHHLIPNARLTPAATYGSKKNPPHPVHELLIKGDYLYAATDL